MVPLPGWYHATADDCAPTLVWSNPTRLSIVAILRAWSCSIASSMFLIYELGGPNPNRKLAIEKSHIVERLSSH